MTLPAPVAPSADDTAKASLTQRSRVVIVLGAGFSRAVYRPCPLTDGLGEAVRARLSPADGAKLPPGEFADGRFEEWLSYLSEPQPFASPAAASVIMAR
jgi:hypothetical protein